MNKYEAHELAALFPRMETDQFADLIADVRRNGLIHPITLYEGKILDGIHREEACYKAGIEPRYEVFDGDDPLAYVISVNMARRHLTESQRAMIAAELANMKMGRPQVIDSKGKSIPSIDGVSTTKAAKMLKTSTSSVERAKTVKKLGEPELVEAVKAGEIAVAPAAAIARRPRSEQKKAVADHHEQSRRRKRAPVSTTSLAKLTSLAWATANSRDRQQFVSAVGAMDLVAAMSDDMKNSILLLLIPETKSVPTQSTAIPDDLSIPNFLRR